MKKKTSIFLIALFSILVITSCENDEVEETTLSLSETSIILPKEASEKTVQITTNNIEWTAITNVDWLSFTQSGATLSIKSTEHSGTNERKAIISVFSGGIGRQITVTQQSFAVSIELIPDAIEIDQWGGERVFDVNSNTKNWEIKSEQDWVEVLPKQFKSEVKINIKENENRADRTAKLILTAGTTIKEFEVKQSGIMYHLLPYLENNATEREIKDFELSRKSELIIDVNSIMGEGLSFETKSKVFGKIEYKMDKGSLTGALITVSDETALTDVAFNKFMEDNKFAQKESKDKSKKLYELKKDKFTVISEVVIGDLKNYIVFVFIP